MLVLALDTAGPNCSVAVARRGARGAAILARAEERLGRGHAERLPPMVDEALAEARIGYNEIDRIAVTTGPGSFTGVRVGIAFARGLALALDVPAVGIGTLHALAHSHGARCEGTIAAVLDARRGEVYAFIRDIATNETLVEPEALAIEELASRLRDARPPIVLTGSGAPLVVATLAASAEIAGTAEAPDIADVVALALESAEAGSPLPLYARSADAKPQLGKAVARR
jgi:tRNA threonylcarbamoyladenosine biosynthesis protein TsaB